MIPQENLREKINKIYKWVFIIFLIIQVIGFITIFFPSIRYSNIDQICYDSGWANPDNLEVEQYCTKQTNFIVINNFSTMIISLFFIISILIEVILKLIKKTEKFAWQPIVYIVVILAMYSAFKWIFAPWI